MLLPDPFLSNVHLLLAPSLATRIPMPLAFSCTYSCCIVGACKNTILKTQTRHTRVSVMELDVSAFVSMRAGMVLVADARNNVIQAIGQNTALGQAGLAGVSLELCLQSNSITSLASSAFNGFYGEALALHMYGNPLGNGTGLPDSLLDGCFADAVMIDARSTGLTQAGAVFAGLTAGQSFQLQLGGNMLDQNDLAAMLSSFNGTLVHVARHHAARIFVCIAVVDTVSLAWTVLTLAHTYTHSERERER